MKKTYNELTIEEFLRVLFGFPKKYSLSYTKFCISDEQALNENGVLRKVKGKRLVTKQEIKNKYSSIKGIDITLSDNVLLGTKPKRKEKEMGYKIEVSGTYQVVVSALSYLMNLESKSDYLEKKLLQEFIDNNFDYNLPIPTKYDIYNFLKEKTFDFDKTATECLLESMSNISFTDLAFCREVYTPFELNRWGNYSILYRLLLIYAKSQEERDEIIQKYNPTRKEYNWLTKGDFTEFVLHKLVFSLIPNIDDRNKKWKQNTIQNAERQKSMFLSGFKNVDLATRVLDIFIKKGLLSEDYKPNISKITNARITQLAKAILDVLGEKDWRGNTSMAYRWNIFTEWWGFDKWSDGLSNFQLAKNKHPEWLKPIENAKKEAEKIID